MHDIGFMLWHKHGHPFTDFNAKSRSVSEIKYQCYFCLLLKDSILIQCPIEKRREMSEGVNTRLKINKSKNRQNETAHGCCKLFWTNTVNSTQQSSNCTATFLPSYKVKLTRHADNCRGNKDKFISGCLSWTSTHG